MKCWICESNTEKRTVKLRSGSNAVLLYCKKCEFEFFDHDITKKLIDDGLDTSRLKNAGLDIPKFKKDFQNGEKQSIEYIKKYLNKNDIGKNILEIGCSWGYFLETAKKFGVIPVWS